ncbi:argininosuccinate lyase [Halobacteriales archaeon QS_8_69_26]|nr:MAG: argininosuccinate lyase [Halobacteriales archaeon QS_8_69_26]
MSEDRDGVPGPGSSPEDGADHGGAAGSGDHTAVRGDRFAGGPARGFMSSLAADDRIFAADLAVDRAHVVMLAEQGILDPDEAGAILSALDDVAAAGHGSLPDGEDAHEAIETAVIDSVGEAGGRMHTARSRNDEVATCIRHRFREDLLSAAEATVALREALLSAAEDHADTLMPGFTHAQPAQPTTVGHWLCSYESALARDTARLLDAYDRTNRSPLGAAAFAGTPFDVDRERTAELLGFDGVVDNATDAVTARDFLVEGVAAMANLATTLSGLSTDLIGFARDGYVDLDDDYASTSSIMPQKKNPDSLELARATAGDAAAGLNGLLTTLKGLPRAYNRDLQRATPHAWEAVDAVTEATEIAAGAVATAEWNRHELAAAAGDGFSTATGVADALAMGGVPFRTAHRIVARVAELGMGGDYGAVKAVAEEELDEPLETYVSRETVEAAMDPASNVAGRDSAGGPAPSEVEAAVDDASEALGADAGAVEDRRIALESAENRLDAAVSEYV